MNRHPEVLVIGGGIAGLLTAREFVTAGYATTLIEKQKVGREASWAGGGILSPIYPWRQPESITPLWKNSLLIYPDLATDLHETTGVDPEWRPCGMAVMNHRIDDALTWCANNAIEARRLDRKDAIGLIPRVAINDEPILWLPEIAQIRNPQLIKALKIDLKNKGANLLEGTEALSFSLQHDRIVQVKTNRHTFTADEIIITAGAWSKVLVDGFPPSPEIYPVKGQMLLYRSKPGLLKPILLRGDRYLIPRRDGHILVGSTLEFSGYDKSITVDARMQLDYFAKRLLPCLSDALLVDHWAGLRPGTPSGIPYIGRHPRISNLSFNCGHFRNGFGMGPASARLLADLLANRRPSICAEPYTLVTAH